MGRRYQYVKIQGEPKRFFCLQQSPFYLTWLLFFKKNTLLPFTVENSFKKSSPQWMFKELRRYYSFARTNVLMVASFIKHKFHIKKNDLLVDMPFYGQICVLVNKGHKILDIHRGTAIKVYRNNVDITTITDELDRLKNGSLFEFAPTIRRWNIEERWYEEDYINGTLDYSFYPCDTTTLLKKFSRDVSPYLETLMLYRSPVTENVSDYIYGMKSALRNGDFLSHVSDEQKTGSIWTFFDFVSARILADGNMPVYLVLSHGDFCPANMLNTKQGLKIIDWESATSRSALFDFYSYFFFRPLHQNLSLDQFSSEIISALPLFLSELDMAAPEMTAALRSADKKYRWLFYIERIYMLIERQRYDTKLNVMENIFKYIDIFRQYEEICSDNTDNYACIN